jgi:hypothetical protein
MPMRFTYLFFGKFSNIPFIIPAELTVIKKINSLVLIKNFFKSQFSRQCLQNNQSILKMVANQ